jgi:hypothetical protein
LDLMKWEAGIPGKAGTAWENGMYKLWLLFPEEYPTRPPKCTIPRVPKRRYSARAVDCLMLTRQANLIRRCSIRMCIPLGLSVCPSSTKTKDGNLPSQSNRSRPPISLLMVDPRWNPRLTRQSKSRFPRPRRCLRPLQVRPPFPLCSFTPFVWD